MNKELILYDHTRQSHLFEIPHFEDVLGIEVDIVSDDEVASVYYRNYNRKTFDADVKQARNTSRWGGTYRVCVGEIERFNNLPPEKRLERYLTR